MENDTKNGKWNETMENGAITNETKQRQTRPKRFSLNSKSCKISSEKHVNWPQHLQLKLICQLSPTDLIIIHRNKWCKIQTITNWNNLQTE